MTIKSWFVFGILSLMVAGLGFVAYQQYQAKKSYAALLSTKATELQEANLKIGKAETKIADATNLIDKLNQDIQDEVKRRNLVLKLYAELEAQYIAVKDKVQIVTKIIYQDKEIPIPAGKIFVKLTNGTFEEVTSMKFNYSDFRLTIEGDAVKQVLTYKLHQKFRAIFVEAVLPNGIPNHYAELYELDAEGKDAGRLELTNFKVVRSEDIKAKMHWLNPKLDLGLGYGIHGKGHGWTGSVGLSISGYGPTPNDLTWRFFRTGVQIMDSSEFILNFSPVQYNIGAPLPLISNLWIVPSVGYNFTANTWATGLELGVVF